MPGPKHNRLILTKFLLVEHALNGKSRYVDAFGIPWSMWKHRNDIEHANDLQKEMTETDKAIQEELERGSDN